MSSSHILVGQDRCSSREEVLGLDRWIHLGFPFHIPEFVVLKAGVRRIWSGYCSSQVLLNRWQENGVVGKGITGCVVQLGGIITEYYCEFLVAPDFFSCLLNLD